MHIREKRLKLNYLNFYLKKLAKRKKTEQSKPKESRIMEIIKIEAGWLGSRKTSNKENNWSQKLIIKKINKFDYQKIRKSKDIIKKGEKASDRMGNDICKWPRSSI